MKMHWERKRQIWNQYTFHFEKRTQDVTEQGGASVNVRVLSSSNFLLVICSAGSKIIAHYTGNQQYQIWGGAGEKNPHQKTLRGLLLRCCGDSRFRTKGKKTKKSEREKQEWMKKMLKQFGAHCQIDCLHWSCSQSKSHECNQGYAS